MEESYMSSMDNHRRRSRRGNRMKQAAFGSMARRPYITPARYKNTTFGLKASTYITIYKTDDQFKFKA